MYLFRYDIVTCFYGIIYSALKYIITISPFQIIGSSSFIRRHYTNLILAICTQTKVKMK
jgi:hypothetical protein